MREMQYEVGDQLTINMSDLFVFSGYGLLTQTRPIKFSFLKIENLQKRQKVSGAKSLYDTLERTSTLTSIDTLVLLSHKT